MAKKMWAIRGRGMFSVTDNPAHAKEARSAGLRVTPVKKVSVEETDSVPMSSIVGSIGRSWYVKAGSDLKGLGLARPRKRRRAGNCKYGKVKSGPRKGMCRVRPKRRR